MMSKYILILIRRGPYGGFQAAEGLRHANGFFQIERLAFCKAGYIVHIASPCRYV
jgi:sulfur relay (sulfurtransferase) DsrF/TusC family protein